MCQIGLAECKDHCVLDCPSHVMPFLSWSFITFRVPFITNRSLPVHSISIFPYPTIPLHSISCHCIPVHFISHALPFSFYGIPFRLTQRDASVLGSYNRKSRHISQAFLTNIDFLLASNTMRSIQVAEVYGKWEPTPFLHALLALSSNQEWSKRDAW